jgi:hypothetical protein
VRCACWRSWEDGLRGTVYADSGRPCEKTNLVRAYADSKSSWMQIDTQLAIARDASRKTERGRYRCRWRRWSPVPCYTPFSEPPGRKGIVFCGLRASGSDYPVLFHPSPSSFGVARYGRQELLHQRTTSRLPPTGTLNDVGVLARALRIIGCKSVRVPPARLSKHRLDTQLLSLAVSLLIDCYLWRPHGDSSLTPVRS